MVVDSDERPMRTQLWSGAILGSIVHSLMVCQYPEISNEQSWDGINYSVQDNMGSRGTISFYGDDLVGVFFDENSPRNPFRSRLSYNLEEFFRGAPVKLRSLADEHALQYVLQEYQGAAMPVITAAFWNDGERLVAAEQWQQVIENGAHLVRIQLLSAEAARAEWERHYEMSRAQVALARSIFERKMAAPETTLELDNSVRDLLRANCKGAEGMNESRESFAEIGILLP